MYQVNILERNVLITPLEVIFHAPVKHVLDQQTIRHSIIIAEERFLVPALGLPFYTALVNEKNVIVTADNKAALQALVTEHSIPASTAPVLKAGDIVNAMEHLSAANKTLWRQYIWKLTAEAVMLIATPENYVQFAPDGIAHNIPTASPMITSGAVSPDLRAVKWMMDQKLTSRIDPLLQGLQTYICANKALYPLFTTCPCDEDLPRGKRNDIVLGLYDKDPDPCCNFSILL